MISGAGNPVGGSFTGPAEALETIGDHAYAYSGFHTAANTTNGKTVLDFTTGNYYFVGQLIFNGYTAPSEPTYGDDGTCELKLNNSIIAALKCGTASEVMPSNVKAEIVINSYTKVEVAIKAEGSNSDIGSTVILVGRIYRTRD